MRRCTRFTFSTCFRHWHWLARGSPADSAEQRSEFIFLPKIKPDRLRMRQIQNFGATGCAHLFPAPGNRASFLRIALHIEALRFTRRWLEHYSNRRLQSPLSVHPSRTRSAVLIAVASSCTREASFAWTVRSYPPKAPAMSRRVEPCGLMALPSEVLVMVLARAPLLDLYNIRLVS